MTEVNRGNFPDSDQASRHNFCGSNEIDLLEELRRNVNEHDLSLSNEAPLIFD